MKKHIIFVSMLFFISFSAFAQSWTVRDNLGGRIGEVDYEYTVINKDQYDRLLRQRTAMKEFASVTFIDILEMSKTEKIVNGTKPNLNGNYYLLVKLTALTDSGKELLNLGGVGTGLIYGNSNTGALTVVFTNVLGSIFFGGNAALLGSDNFLKIYNLCISFVDGE